MSYRKDQGRYARMAASWALLSLAAYGCFHGGGLSNLLENWLGASDRVFVDPFPILKTLKLSTVAALGALAIIGFLLHRILNTPRVADALIETEAELMKVTWPTWGEAWQGTLAVTAMVVILFAFLTVADLGLIKVMLMLMGGA
ncbi:MAG: preprotein translocase subunit SecE [Planctomycetota bacterium]